MGNVGGEKVNIHNQKHENNHRNKGIKSIKNLFCSVLRKLTGKSE